MIPNPEQDVRAFVINCYKRLYRQGKLSGQGIARHNELVDDYTKKFKCSKIRNLKSYVNVYTYVPVYIYI